MPTHVLVRLGSLEIFALLMLMNVRLPHAPMAVRANKVSMRTRVRVQQGTSTLRSAHVMQN